MKNRKARISHNALLISFLQNKKITLRLPKKNSKKLSARAFFTTLALFVFFAAFLFHFFSLYNRQRKWQLKCRRIIMLDTLLVHIKSKLELQKYPGSATSATDFCHRIVFFTVKMD